MTDVEVRPRPADAADAAAAAVRPGSVGEHRIQDAQGTTARAAKFYDAQMRDQLLPSMVEFVERMSMVFVATSTPSRCDSALRSGAPGFLQVLDPQHLAYPEHRGRGANASLDNIGENPHVGLLMVDFVEARIGLHVNGTARAVGDAALRAEHPQLPPQPDPGADDVWVLVEVEEAFIHCRKHIPRMASLHRGA